MNPQSLTIGIDLGDRRHHVCVLDAAGEIVAEEVIGKHPRGVDRLQRPVSGRDHGAG